MLLPKPHLLTTVSALLLATYIAPALSQSATAVTTITVLYPYPAPLTVVGSIISANPTVTLLVAACPPDTDPLKCAFATGFALTAGAETMQISGGDANIQASLSCTRADDRAVCVESFGGEAETATGPTTETYTESINLLVTVTGGAEKLQKGETTRKSKDISSSGLFHWPFSCCRAEKEYGYCAISLMACSPIATDTGAPQPPNPSATPASTTNAAVAAVAPLRKEVTGVLGALLALLAL